MKTLLSLLLAVSCFADPVRLQLFYSTDGASITIPDVGTGYLEVQRSIDFTNWTTFAIVNNPYAFTNTWTFNDYLSTTYPMAFYRARFTAGKPITQP